MDSEQPQSELPNSKSASGKIKTRILETGESFGNFRVVKCLSAGLIANYYHMQHVRDLHDVTVGIFHVRTMEDGRFLKRLQNLQKTLGGFSHEGIPKIKDCGIINERHCIFLDPIRGQSLGAYFAGNGQPGHCGLAPEQATEVIAQLLGVLGYAHSRGLDHRDLDSELVYVQENGAIQVLGVGIKLTLGVDLFESIVSASVSPLSSEKTVGRLNSFDVMSPEYKAGQSEDSRVDLYAVGMIGYWLITARKASLSKFVEASTIVQELPVAWDEFFSHCLVRDSETRYQSCKIALLALQATEVREDEGTVGLVQRQIDRMLKPVGIISRSKGISRVYRLCFIGIVGLVLTSLTVFYYKDTLIETEAYQRDIAKKATADEEANVVLSIRPPVAKLQFVGYNEKFLAKDGLIRLIVQPSEYALLVTAPHHSEKRLSIDLRENKVALDVELEPAWSDLKIVSVPQASISVLDERGVEIASGETNHEGVFFLQKGIFAGTYTMLIKKEGYETLTLDDQAVAFGKLTELAVDLVPLAATLTIVTQPEGARILIDDQPVGVTPLRIDAATLGANQMVVAHLDGYRSVGRQIEVNAGQGLNLDLGQLVPRAGELSFEVLFIGVPDEEVEALMSELTVQIDSEVMPYGDGIFKEIKEGPRQVRLLHPLYSSSTRTINVSDRDAVEVRAVLSPRPGVLELELPEAISASLFVDDNAVTVVDGQVNVAAGKQLHLQLRIKNHLTMTREITLKPNERFVWKVEPVAIPGPQVGQPWAVPYLGHTFVWVEPGQFNMGSPPVESGRLPNEGPQTQVRFSQGFWMATHEVTQEKFLEIMDRNPSEFEGLQKPVENVSWAQAKQFCQLLSHFEKVAGRLPDGYVYRLPTEAEWEYAARAKTTTPFCFGEEADPSFGNFRGVYPKSWSGAAKASTHYGTVPVGSYQANTLGLYDVNGNVAEWTLDFYSARLPGGSLTDPAPRANGTRIAVRGGSWEDYATAVRSAIRKEVRSDTPSSSIGFRLVLAPVK
ncbi:MAG TPA: hypothetical protein DCX06_05020 [Opitutae bacterium]|nr:hypothetical protein [Opitutae bacterium]